MKQILGEAKGRAGGDSGIPDSIRKTTKRRATEISP